MTRPSRLLLGAIPLVFLLALLVAPALRLLQEGGQLSLWEPWQDP